MTGLKAGLFFACFLYKIDLSEIDLFAIQWMIAENVL